MTRKALVTGGNRGIGLEIVRGLVQKGFKVIMACRDKELGDSAAAELAMPDIHVVEMNLSDPESIKQGLSVVESVFGEVDILVNNAGVLMSEQLEELELDDLNTSFQVHVAGPAMLIKSVLPTMQDNGFGRIINVTSGWGAFSENMQGPPAYAITKAALNALTMNLANSMAEDANVTINSVCPGWVHTRMGGSDAPRSPQQGADTVIWLASLDVDCPNGGFFRDRLPVHW